MSTKKFGQFGTREEFLTNEIRTLNRYISQMIETMKVMQINRQDMSEEVERLNSKVEKNDWRGLLGIEVKEIRDGAKTTDDAIYATERKLREKNGG